MELQKALPNSQQREMGGALLSATKALLIDTFGYMVAPLPKDADYKNLYCIFLSRISPVLFSFHLTEWTSC